MPLMPAPGLRAGGRRPNSFLVTPGTPEMPISDFAPMLGFSSPTSAVYPSANLIIALPFWLSQPGTCFNLFCANGAAVSGNVDMGILDASGNRLVSAGTTAQAGTSTFQIFNTTDLFLEPDTLYYLALQLSNITGTFLRWAPGLGAYGRAVGLKQVATTFPIPASNTLANFAQTYVPYIGLDLRGTTF